MARILDDQGIIQHQIQENLTNALEDYSDMLSSAPSYLAYYNKKVSASSQDAHLDVVYQVAGDESPVRFNRIDSFPIYGLEQLTLDLSAGTFGPEAEVSSPALILPGTITPFPDDFIAIEYDDAGTIVVAMFQVTSVSKSIMNSKRFNQLTIRLSSETLAQVEEQKDDELEFSVTDYENNRTPILKSTLAQSLRRCRSFREQMSDLYGTYFYDRSTSSFLHYDGSLPGKIVNYMAHHSMEITQALEFQTSFYDNTSVLLSPRREAYVSMLAVEKQTFYYAIRHPETLMSITSEALVAYRSSEVTSIFFAFPGDYYEAMHPCVTVPTDAFQIAVGDPGFLAQAQSLTLFPGTGRELENFIITYLADRLDTESEVIDHNALLDMVPDIEIMLDLRSFMLIPCALIVLKAIEESILGVTSP